MSIIKSTIADHLHNMQGNSILVHAVMNRMANTIEPMSGSYPATLTKKKNVTNFLLIGCQTDCTQIGCN